MPARPSKAKDELAHCGLSVEKSKFYDRLREIFVCGPRCGNIWKAIKMQPYDTTSPISLTHSLFLSHNWWHYYQRKTNIHKIVRFSSTISRHARLARVSICFSSVKFVSIFSSFMRFLLKQWQRWWYGLRPDLFSPLALSLHEFDMILTSRPIGCIGLYVLYMYIPTRFMSISSIRFRFYCGSFAVAVAPVAPPPISAPVAAAFTTCNWC